MPATAKSADRSNPNIRSGLIEKRRRPWVEPEISPEDREAVERAAEAYIAVAELVKKYRDRSPRGRAGFPEKTGWQILDEAARSERHWTQLASLAIERSYSLRPDLLRYDSETKERNRQIGLSVRLRNAAQRRPGQPKVSKMDRAVAAWKECPEATVSEIARAIGVSKATASQARVKVKEEKMRRQDAERVELEEAA